MNRLFAAAGAAVGLTAVAFCVMGFARTERRSARATAGGDGAGRVPVLVELFTSEGCSSCPPADVALAELQKGQPIEGAQIIALSEHVDYWNYLGWADPYSSSLFSDRQRAYAGALRLPQIYTPQLVVDGRLELVGSNRDQAESAIQRARQASHAEVTLERVTTPGTPERVHVTVPAVRNTRSGEPVDVVLAFTEDNLRSSVVRGENAGRNLSHAAVVRQMRSLGTLTPGRPFSVDAPVRLDGRWKVADVSAVVFLQERTGRRILGAAILPLAPSNGRP